MVGNVLPFLKKKTVEKETVTPNEALLELADSFRKSADVAKSLDDLDTAEREEAVAFFTDVANTFVRAANLSEKHPHLATTLLEILRTMTEGVIFVVRLSHNFEDGLNHRLYIQRKMREVFQSFSDGILEIAEKVLREYDAV